MTDLQGHLDRLRLATGGVTVLDLELAGLLLDVVEEASEVGADPGNEGLASALGNLMDRQEAP